MADKTVKTNAERMLDKMKIAHKEYLYDGSQVLSGVEVAALLGQDERRVFKTLVTVGKSGAHYVFMIPVAEELDLKKAARAVGEKSVEMVKSKELLPLTGYVHGGCSPIGMKKFFRTTVHESAKDCSEIIFSGGKIGCQIETSPENLAKAVRFGYADIVKRGEA